MGKIFYAVILTFIFNGLCRISVAGDSAQSYTGRSDLHLSGIDLESLRELIQVQLVESSPDSFMNEANALWDLLASLQDRTDDVSDKMRICQAQLWFFDSAVYKIESFTDKSIDECILFNTVGNLLFDGALIENILKAKDRVLILKYIERVVRFSCIIDARIDPNYDSSTIALYSNVGVPGGDHYPSGVSPDDVKEPELREKYIEAIKKNRKNAKYINRQKRVRVLFLDVQKRSNKTFIMIRKDPAGKEVYDEYFSKILVWMNIDSLLPIEESHDTVLHPLQFQ